MNKNVLVTGATGFIGHHLCDRLYEDGYRVFAFGRKDENKIKCHEFYTSNLRSIPWRDIPKIDICFHLAADDGRFSREDSEIMDTNFQASSNLFKGLLDLGCTKFVYSSCCSVYGEHPSPSKEDAFLEGYDAFSKSKIAFENFAKGFSSRTKATCVGLRYTNVYGTYEFYKRSKASVIIQIIKKLYKGESPVVFKDGEQRRDYVYVKDVVDANILASKCTQSDIFNIGSGDTPSVNEIFYSIIRRMKKNITLTYKECPPNEARKELSVSLKKSSEKLGYGPKYKVEDGIQELKIMLGKLFS